MMACAGNPEYVEIVGRGHFMRRKTWLKYADVIPIYTQQMREKDEACDRKWLETVREANRRRYATDKQQ